MLKKMLSVLVLLAVTVSMLSVPASASGFSEANKNSAWDSNFELKGWNRPDYVTREHTGSGVDRVVTLTSKKILSGSRSNQRELLSYLTKAGVTAKYAHARLLFKNTVSGSNDYEEFWLRSAGAVASSAEGAKDSYLILGIDRTTGKTTSKTTGVAAGRMAWKFGEYNTMDMVFDLGSTYGKGMVYLFLNGEYVGAAKNGPTNGTFYGYAINTRGADFEPGNVVEVKFDSSRPGHTIYNDTPSYSVTFEDVLTDAGLADEITPESDPRLIMSASNMENYMSPDFKTGSPAVSIQGDPANTTVSADSATIINTTEDNIATSMLRGMYYKDNTVVDGKLILLSFDQKIVAGDPLGYRIRTAANDAPILSFMNEGGKMKVKALNTMNVLLPDAPEAGEVTGGFGADGGVLEKDYLNTIVHVDMLFDRSTGIAHYYVDGEHIGSSKYSTLSNSRFNDIDIVSQPGGEVTISNWNMKVYDEKKDVNECKAEITGRPIYWSSGETENGMEISDDLFAAYVTANDTFGTNNSGRNLNIYAAIYDTNDKLISFTQYPYVSGNTSADDDENNIFAYSGNEAKIKFFVWNDADTLTPLAEANTLYFADYLSAE